MIKQASKQARAVQLLLASSATQCPAPCITGPALRLYTVSTDWQLKVHAHLQVVNWQRAIILDYAEKVGLCPPGLKYVLSLLPALVMPDQLMRLLTKMSRTTSHLNLLHADRWTCSSTTTQPCSQHAQSTSSQLS